jgi:hypothetical protein
MKQVIATCVATSFGILSVVAACYDLSTTASHIPTRAGACANKEFGATCEFYQYDPAITYCWSGPQLTGKTCAEVGTKTVNLKRYTGTCDTSTPRLCSNGSYYDIGDLPGYVDFAAVADNSCDGSQ